MQLVAPCLVTPSAKKTAANNSRSNNQRTSLLRASALQRSSANLPRAQCGATSLFHMSTSRHLCLIGILNKTTTQLIPSQKKMPVSSRIGFVACCAFKGRQHRVMQTVSRAAQTKATMNNTTTTSSGCTTKKKRLCSRLLYNLAAGRQVCSNPVILCLGVDLSKFCSGIAIKLWMILACYPKGICDRKTSGMGQVAIREGTSGTQKVRSPILATQELSAV